MPTKQHRTCATLRRLYRIPRPLLTPLMLAALGLAGVARAQDASPSVDDLVKRIEALETSNRELAGEVVTLRKAEGDGWLTEARANEIRSIVSDVLADSESRNSLQSSGMTAGWNNGFFLESADGRFRLDVSGTVQTRFIYGYVPNGNAGTGPSAPAALSDTRENISGFELPGTILELSGHVLGREFQYKLKGEFTNIGDIPIGEDPVANLGDQGSSFRLLDAYIRTELGEGFALRTGQFKLPFAREQLVDRQHLLAVARSTIVEHLGIGRSQGIELAWVSDDIRSMFAASNGGSDNVYGLLKAAGTEPLGSPWESDGVDYALTLRNEWKIAGQWHQFETMTSPPGDEYALMIGTAVNWQSGDPDLGSVSPSGPPNEWFGATIDASAMYGGGTLFASFTYMHLESGQAYIQGPFATSPTNIGGNSVWGGVIQGSFYCAPKWELFARYEIGDVNIPNIARIPAAAELSNGNLLSIMTIGVNSYIDGEDLKWSCDFGIAFDSFDGVWDNTANGWRPSGEGGELVFRTQLQLMF